jgi:hypothetical protein
MFVILEAGRFIYGDILLDLITSLLYPDGNVLRLKVCPFAFFTILLTSIQFSHTNKSLVIQAV